ncbi:MAG: hypothetical protein ACT4QB_05665 [Gammaproteobacteria bacterium]
MLSQLGSVHERFNEVQVAIEYYGEAAKLRPNDGSIDVELGLAYERYGAIAQAIESFERALKKSATEMTPNFRRTLESRIINLRMRPK